jgi:hypothetical protein
MVISMGASSTRLWNVPPAILTAKPDQNSANAYDQELSARMPLKMNR